MFAAYAALAVLHTFPMILDLAHRTPVRWNSLTSLYVVAEQARLLFAEHPFDFYAAFDPPIMAPMESPLFLSNTLLGNSILLAPAYLATGNLHLAVNLLVLFFLTASACSVFLLARYWLESDRAAFVAGAAYSFASANLFLLNDFSFLNFVFVPLIVLFFERFAREAKPRLLAAAAALMVVQFYTSFYHAALALILLAVLAAARWRILLTRRNAVPLIASSLAAAAAVLPLVIPYGAALARYHFGLDNVERPMARFSLAPIEWITAAPENPLWGAWLARSYTPRRLEIMGAFFPGLTAIALGLIALGRPVVGKISTRLLLGLTAFAVIAATGLQPFSFHKQPASLPVVLYVLGEIVPIFSLFRVTFRFVALASLPAAILVGAGYLLLERAALPRLKRLSPLLLAASVTAAVNLENLAIPRGLACYDSVFYPSAGDEWLAASKRPAGRDEPVFHVPSFLFNFNLWDMRYARQCFEESYAPLYRQIANRRAVVEGRMSAVPDEWVPRAVRDIPSPSGFEHLRALGVTTVIVHDRLLHGTMAARFTDERLRGAGLRLLRAFSDGDRVYEIAADVARDPRLFLAASVVEGSVRVDFRTARSGGAYAYWRNPERCAKQRMRITVADGRGRTVTKTHEYALPLVLAETTRRSPLMWNLADEGLSPPYRIVSIGVREPYLLRFEDARPSWRLERIP